MCNPTGQLYPMSNMRKSSVSYAPRGVMRKQIALRLLAAELAKHEILVKQSNTSSAAFARQMYLRGVRSYERSTAAVAAGSAASSTGTGVNRT